MVELFVLAVLGFCALVVVGTLVAAGSMLWWLVTLPFRLIGWVFRGAVFLVALPFILLAGVIAALALGVGALFLFVPLVPIALLAWLVVWWVRRSVRQTATTH